jgi:ribosome-associated heat shock protein Hsp15
MDKMRIDKWLWCARFYKTRALAAEDLDKGRVQINGVVAKPAREVKPGDRLQLRQGPVLRELVVQGLSGQRGPASVAQQLYEESADSVMRREQAAEQRRLTREPAADLHGRPTKRERRELDRKNDHGWNERWSASHD